MLNAASDIMVGAVMKDAAPGALRECQMVRCLVVSVASKVQFRYSCFGLSSPAKVSFCSASC
eukprot:8219298-Prorocentrum_lima.AAC.1